MNIDINFIVQVWIINASKLHQRQIIWHISKIFHLEFALYFFKPFHTIPCYWYFAYSMVINNKVGVECKKLHSRCILQDTFPRFSPEGNISCNLRRLNLLTFFTFISQVNSVWQFEHPTGNNGCFPKSQTRWL